ncbi:MAG: class I SAM-dependent methyltransferase [Hyphomicrobiales bacterium]
MIDEKTLSVYSEKADEYAAMSERVDKKDPSLAAFIAAMPEQGRVLDLGCGPGGCAARMARTGLQVDALDPVAEMVALAQAHPGVTATQGTFDDLEGSARYDGIWANFSLLHAPRQDMPSHLARIAEALKQGGRFHIAVKTGTGSHRDTIGRLYTYYTETELTALLADVGLSVIDRREGTSPGLSGELAHWIALAARRD